MRQLVIAVIRAYQLALSPHLGGACRYYPSCSEYAIQVIGSDGAWRGSRRAVGRLLRCHPLASGGLDLP
ncbi:MAG: membrane protein insertion efficiency factor YidD [Myxococcota bacterium]